MGIHALDHKKQFEKVIQPLTYNRVKNREKRIRLIDAQIEKYICETGLVPDNKQLERLATAILYEDLQGDMRPDKVTLQERPILTYAQVKRRQNNEVSF